MKQVTVSVPGNGQIIIPAELVRLAHLRAGMPLSCGWSEGSVVLAPAPGLGKPGSFRDVAACPIRADGTIHLPYQAARALHVGPGDRLTLRIKTGQISVTKPGPEG